MKIMRNIFMLFFVFGLLLSGCWKQQDSEKIKFSVKKSALKIQTQPLLLLFDSSDKYGEMCHRQATKAMNYAKIPFVEYDIVRFPHLPDSSRYSTVVTVTENLWKFDRTESEKLKQFVSKGGGLAVLYRTWNEYLPELFGVKNRSEPAFIDSAQTVNFQLPFLPGGENLKANMEDVSNCTYRPEEHVTLIARTEDFPIVWFHEFGKGKVIYWNTGMLARKINRGYIVRSIAAVQPFTVTAIANVAIFDLDDYPNSSYNAKLEPIKSEFDMTISEFYILKWYPDMLRLAKEFGVKYTSALIFNYNGQRTPPFKFYEWLNGKITLGGKTIPASLYAARNLSNITELGLHGYNHQSLSLKIWKNTTNMKLALETSKNRWKIENLGELPKSYVPPLNIYDSTGVAILHQVFPSIEQIGALYLGHFEQGQFREFGPEPWNKDLYVIPRNTSGYILTEFFRNSMISLLNCNGVWAHFVHPDDVFPTGERYSKETLKKEKISALSWYDKAQNDGLYFQLKNWPKFAKKNYPYLRYMKRSDALSVMKMFDKTKLGASCNKNIINIEVNVVPAYWAVFLSNKNALKGLIGCELIHEHKTHFGTHLIVKANEHVMMLQFENNIYEKGER